MIQRRHIVLTPFHHTASWTLIFLISLHIVSCVGAASCPSPRINIERGGSASLQDCRPIGTRQRGSVRRSSRYMSPGKEENKSDVGWIGQFLLRRVTHQVSPCRTRFSWFGQPSDDELHQLFENNYSQKQRFNHDCVGMTHPVIHSPSRGVDVDDDDNSGMERLEKVSHAFHVDSVNEPVLVQQLGSKSDGSCTQARVASGNGRKLYQSLDKAYWIPDALFMCQQQTGKRHAQSKETEWRTIRIRSSVGRGKECYEAVRDAILSWERTLPVVDQKSASEKRNCAEKPFWAYIKLLNYTPSDDCSRRTSGIFSSTSMISNDSPAVLQIGGPCKKIVTVSRSPIPFLNLWTYNPCQVIYDVVDQRWVPPPVHQQEGPARHSHGLTYTSTAYATLQGHLLSGEERVSVVLHDAPSSKVEVEVLSYSRPTKGPLGRIVFPLIKSVQERFFADQVKTLVEIGRISERSVSSTILSPERAGMHSGAQITLGGIRSFGNPPEAGCVFAAENFGFERQRRRPF